MIFKANESVLFLGDSITDSNKSGVEGSYLWDVLGSGYVNMVNSYFLLYHPKLNLRIINQGISGNRTTDLLARLDKDVISYNPDHVVLMIGVNDAWRQLDCPQIPEYKQTTDDYKKNVLEIISRIQNNQANIVLMSPFYLEPNRENTLRAKIDAYNVVLKEIAETHGLLYIDLQKAFDELLEEVSIFTISGDRIHLNMAGNMFLRDQVIEHLTK
jgi:lysophospholipase L1-like esterase